MPEHDHELNQPTENDFPSEAEWLRLPCPEFAGDFVDLTLQRVLRDDGLPDLEADQLATFAPPPPSADFVDRVLGKVTGDPELCTLLAHQRVPEPSQDFVDRVLAALREEPRRRFRLVPQAALAAAAALLLSAFAWLMLSSTAPTPRDFALIAARDEAPDPFARRAVALHERGLALHPRDPALHLAALAGMRVTR